MLYAKSILIGITLLASSIAVTEETSPSKRTLPDLPEATMQVPWSDFKSLIEEVRAAAEARDEALREAKKTAKPPIPWSIAEARYDAEAVDASSVRIEAELQIQVWEPEQWVQIPVIGDSVAPISVTLDGKPVGLDNGREGNLVLLTKGVGEHSLQIAFYVGSVSTEGVVSLEFPCAATPLTQMTLRVPVKDATVNSPTASNITVERREDGIVAELAFRRADKLAVSWTLPAVAVEAPPAEEPRKAATSWTLATVTENYVSCKSQLRYDILSGEANSFSLDLPSNASLLSVTGQGAVWSQTAGDDRQLVEVKTNHKVSDVYDLNIAYEMRYEGDAIETPLLRTIDTVRENGHIGVAARGNIEITPAADAHGLTRIDAAELPAELLATSVTPVLLAFRHGGDTPRLALSVRRLTDVAVPDSNIEQASLTTVITNDGMAVTQATFEMVNNVRQFLRVQIDKTAEVWSAEVGDALVKPARDANNGDVLIPLAKSVEVNRRPGAFPVKLLYMEHIAPPTGMNGKVALQSPSTDVMSNSVNWQVFLPESRRMFRAEGDLAPVVSASRNPESDGTPRRPTTAVRQETIHRLREGIERFFITDINNPAGVSQSGEARYQGAPLNPTEVGSAPTVSAIAGVLPVHIDFPVGGTPYSFKRVLAPKGQSLKLVISTYPSVLHKVGYYIFSALACFAGFAAWRMVVLRLQRHRWAWGWTSATILCVAALVLLGRVTNWSFASFAWMVISGIVASVWLSTRTRERQAESSKGPICLAESMEEE